MICMTQSIACAGIGVITSLFSYYDGTYSWLIVDNGTTGPSCGNMLYVVRSDNPSYNLMSATALTAYSMGKSVNLGGSTCNAWPGRVDLNMIWVTN